MNKRGEIGDACQHALRLQREGFGQPKEEDVIRTQVEQEADIAQAKQYEIPWWKMQKARAELEAAGIKFDSYLGLANAYARRIPDSERPVEVDERLRMAREAMVNVETSRYMIEDIKKGKYDTSHPAKIALAMRDLMIVEGYRMVTDEMRDEYRAGMSECGYGTLALDALFAK